jgi:hypothetical protein
MENWFFKRLKKSRDRRAEIARGLDCYDPESRVFPGVAKRIQQGRDLTKRDVLLILRWKTPSFKKSYSQTVNDDNMLKITKAVRDAGETGREIEALKALDEIPEIGLPVASAILTVCYPDKFTILDIRVLGILALYPSRLESNKPSKPADDQWTAEDYWKEFLPTIQQRSKEWCCTLRNADRVLWGLSVANEIDETIGISAQQK